jgi:hypothetical protein
MRWLLLHACTVSAMQQRLAFSHCTQRVGARRDSIMGVPALTACLAQAKEIPAASAQWAEEFDSAQAAQRVRPRQPRPLGWVPGFFH